MATNTNRETVTMRHPDVDNELVCFDFQVEHHKSLGWRVVTDDAPTPAKTKPKAKPEADSPTTTPEEG